MLMGHANMRVARPTLIIVLTLVSVWFTGFILLLAHTGSLSNPVEAGRSLLANLAAGPQVYTQAPAIQEPYQYSCSSLPFHAAELSDLDARWGKVGLEMSVAHRGSGIRMRRALRRLISGEPFLIAVIGGSISEGHGIHRDTGGLPYAEHLQNTLQKVYPNVTVHNGGRAGHGTDYFSNCYQLHSPVDADLYILESAVNDLENEMKVSTAGEKLDIVGYTEILVRQLLSNRPDNAVMMLSSFGSDKPFGNAAHLHNVVSEYYDIPRMSMRIFMYPYMLQFPDERKSHFDSPDIRHPNGRGHKYMADILLRYILREACRAAHEQDEDIVPHSLAEYVPAVEGLDPTEPVSYDPARVNDDDKQWLPYPGVGGSLLKYKWDPFTLPSLRIGQHWLRDKHARPEGAAFCTTADVLAADGLPTMRPVANNGWEHYVDRGKHYWKATQPGSTITFDNIEVHAGILSVFHMRCDQNYGNAKCWVDNNKNQAVTIVSTWKSVCISALHVVSEKLNPGKHSLTCEVLEETDDKNGQHDFAISAIVSH